MGCRVLGTRDILYYVQYNTYKLIRLCKQVFYNSEIKIKNKNKKFFIIIKLNMEFRLNTCPICLTCLDCKNKYGQNCTCQARKVKWKRKKIERDYTI